MYKWVRWSAWLCLTVLLWTVAAESVHTHPSATDAASCSICVVAHTASPAVIFGHSAPIFAAVGLLQVEDIVAKARFDFSDQGIRGPPVL